jgi:rSAM/selenodomain-associated transferase 1
LIKLRELGSNRCIPAGLCALAVMTKAPRAGMVKTRLVPPLSSKEAASLSACFLKDTTESISAVCKRMRAAGVAVYTPLGEESAFDGILPGDFSMLCQRGEGFGERLFHAAEDLFSLGFASVCLIDADSPTLPQDFLEQAVVALSKPQDRVILGPAEDGGYYLIGLKAAHREVFKNIEWSTPGVLKQTIDRAEAAGLKVKTLPAWYDVDDAATLGRLCHELFGEASVPRGNSAPNTRSFLEGILKSEGPDRIRPTAQRFNGVRT